MKSIQGASINRSPQARTAWLVLPLLIAFLAAITQASAATNVVIWDTGKPLGDSGEMDSRTDWKAVPSELFAFEAEPLKAASDPGYYGREYSFKGDVVVENQRLAAVFWSARGLMALYAKSSGPSPMTNQALPEGLNLGAKILEVSLQSPAGQPGTLSRFEIVRNVADEVLLEVAFAGAGSPGRSALFSFGKNEIIGIKPDNKVESIHLRSTLDYGVVPGFVGDDLIVSPETAASGNALSLPAENVFVGLLAGEGHELVMTWPTGKQQLKLNLAGEASGSRRLDSIDFTPDGQSLYLAALSAPGLWHREELKPTYLEKDIALNWKRPFPARWKTQLTEADVRTTFAFREVKGTVWRGVPGSYNYPAWFEGERALFHLSKKVPPKGESLIYFLEGQDTPLTVATPVDILKATLGRSQSESIVDEAGRKLRTHHRRGGDGVHRACTCGCTEAIQAVFEAGEEVNRKETVKEALSDMCYFVDRHVERIEEYQQFAGEMISWLRAKATASPELKAYLENLEQIVQQIPQEYNVQKENMKSPQHAGELVRQTMALTESKRTNNLASYMQLLKAWRAMGGAQDYVVAQCHMITRKLFQEAGYTSVQDAKAVPLAQEIRARCRQVLRNPDGYEIWTNY